MTEVRHCAPLTDHTGSAEDGSALQEDARGEQGFRELPACAEIPDPGAHLQAMPI